VNLKTSAAEVRASLGATATETLDAIASRNPSVAAALKDPAVRQKVLDENSSLLADASSPRAFHVGAHFVSLAYKAQIPLALFTSRTWSSAVRGLKAAKLDHYFSPELIVTTDRPTGIAPKPSGEGLSWIVSKVGATDPATVVFVGDRDQDHQAATAASVTFFGCGWTPHPLFSKPQNILPIRNLFDCWTLGLVPTVSPDVSTLEALVARKRLTAFVGAGFSLEAGLADWPALVGTILGPELPDEVPPGALTRLIDRFCARHREVGRQHINQTVQEAFGNGVPQHKHRMLAELDLPRIWTTNFDTLVEEAFASAPQLVTEDKELTVDQGRCQVVKLNGSVGTKHAPIVLGDQDFHELFETRAELLSELSTDLASRTAIFLGCGFADPLLTALLHGLHSKTRTRGTMPTHYTLAPALPGETSELGEDLKDYSIREIAIPNWPAVDDVLTELKWRSRPHVAVISGAAAPESTAETQAQYLETLGELLIEAGFHIRVGNGPVVSEHLIAGAYRACEAKEPNLHRRAITRYNRVLHEADFLDDTGAATEVGIERLRRLLTPVGSTVFVEPGPTRETLYDPLRREMLRGADVCIAVGGSAHPRMGKTGSRGMMAERDLAGSCPRFPK